MADEDVAVEYTAPKDFDSGGALINYVTSVIRLKNHVHLLTQNNRGKHTSQEIWVLPVGWWILASHS